MKKKLLTLVVAATMALSFAACGSDGNNSASTGSSATTQSSVATTQSSAATTQSSASAESSSQAESDVMTLEDWLQTDDAKTAESQTNSALASTGMSVKLAADGDIFVYEYTLPNDDTYSSLTADDLAAAFDPVIEANKAGLADLFKSFEDSYGIKLGGARFTFLTADGTELYSGDVANE